MGFPLKDYYSKIVFRYDLVNRLFTLGMDKKWRKEAVKECLNSKPENIIDICCGTGDLTLMLYHLAEKKVNITGYDFSREMISVAKKKAALHSAENIEFTEGDVAAMPFKNNYFDSATIAFGIRNLVFKNPDSAQHITEIRRILKPGATFVILESGVPSNPVIRAIYHIFLRFVLVPLGGLLTGEWKAYRYLARSSANFFNIREFREFLVSNGFIILSLRTFFLGAANLISCRKE